MKIRNFFGLLWEALKGWSSDDIPRLGASLAYYTLFSIAPILLIAIAIAGMAFGPEAVRGQLVGQIDDLLGREGARAVEALLEGARQQKAGVLAVIVGTVTFLIASTGAFLELQHALNTIFRVKTEAKNKLLELLKDRIRSFGLVLAIGFLLLVSLLVSAALSALSGWMAKSIPVGPTFWRITDVLVSLAVVTALFALIFRYLPDVRLRWSEVRIGAAVTAVLFLIGKQLIGLYLGRSSVASSYGAAGSVVVLLLWVYYSSQILLLGAELTRVYAYHRHGEPKPTEIAKRAPETHPAAELQGTARPSEATRRRT